MPRLLLSDLLTWSGGQLLTQPSAGEHAVFVGISTDTRLIRPDSLFLALHGQNHDGHDYLTAAMTAGAKGLLIDDRTAYGRLPASPGVAVILTADTLLALQAIAAGYRQTLPAKIIGITGSVGKTSTRQMVSACLHPALRVHQTSGNLNNEIGLPHTLLLSEPVHAAVVLEMGMRGAGEISLLSRIANPDIALVTCIGLSHVGRLGSQAAILSAKMEIVDGLRPDGLLVLNGDDLLLKAWQQEHGGQRRLAWISTEPGQAAELSLQSSFAIGADQIFSDAGGSQFTACLWQKGNCTGRFPVNLPMPGEHHIHNTLFGLAVAHELAVDLTAAARGAALCQNTGNRQRLISEGGLLIMDDSYNASPESMSAALQTMEKLAGGRRLIAALGCMLELGDYAAAAHFEIGRQVVIRHCARLLATGPNAADLVAGAHSVDPDFPADIFVDNISLATALTPELTAGDCLLVKGSRGFAMEKVTEAVRQHISETENKTC
jgi:UDP-N-acetylmuramoyl-tripeptide--D-alanyl-D-alanine ligase